MCVRLLNFQQLLSGIHGRPLIPDLWIIIRFSAAHPAGAVDLALGKSSCGTSCPCGDKLIASKLAEDSLLTMDCAHALFTMVTAVSVQLYSLPDSSGRLQESSRKHALLQAAYLPRRKSVIPHYFNPFCFGYCTSAGAEMQGIFQVRRIIFYHAINKEYARGRSPSRGRAGPLGQDSDSGFCRSAAMRALLPEKAKPYFTMEWTPIASSSAQ